MTFPSFDLTDEPPGKRMIVYASPLDHGSKTLAIDSEDLKKYFNQFGEVHQAYVEEWLQRAAYVRLMNSEHTKKAIAHNKGVHVIEGSTVHVRRYPKPIRVVWPSSENPILSSVHNILNNSGLDKPETLMSLVAPYLSYEDTCRCMQLNSNYYAFIDNNWTNMTTKTIAVHIEEYSGSGSFVIVFGEYREDQYSLRMQNVVDITDNSLTNRTHTQFLNVFLRKNASLKTNSEETLAYSIDNKQQGLQLILKALFLRFSIQSLVIDISDFDLLPVIESTAQEYYPSSSNVSLRFSINDEISPQFHKIAETLDVREYSICQDFIDRENATINVNSLNTNKMVIQMLTQEWDPRQMHAFIKDWQEGNRNIKGFHIHTTQCIDLKWEPKFELLCELLSVEVWRKKLDGIYLAQFFQISREDGKVLKILMKLYRGYGGYIPIHEEPTYE